MATINMFIATTSPLQESIASAFPLQEYKTEYTYIVHEFEFCTFINFVFYNKFKLLTPISVKTHRS